MDVLFVQNSVLSIILGFMIGFQREMYTLYANKQHDFGGSRTFAIICLFGFLSAWMTSFIPNLFLVSIVIIGAILISAYIVNNMQSQEKGVTTEFSAIVTFLIGAILVFAPIMVAVFVTIIVLVVLNIKEKLQEYEKILAKRDLNAAILFMMMTFVILPILPDKPIDAWGLINLYRIWLMVVLVAGISFFGYIAIRLLGTTHGIGVAGFFGGLVSSTAVAMSMARKAKDNLLLVKNLAVAITLASSVMLIRAWFEVFVINPSLADTLLLATIVASISGYIYIIYLFITAKKEHIDQDITFKNPFELNEALLMGLLFGVIVALITISKEYVGDTGVYVVSFLSGLADIDAVVLSLSSCSTSGLPASTAINGILLAIWGNTITKLSMIWLLGGRELAKYIAIYYTITIPLFSIIVLIGV